MTPVTNHLPFWKLPTSNPGTGTFPDTTSGIRNADKFSRELSQRIDRFIYAFLLGLLAGALLATGLTLYFF